MNKTAIEYLDYTWNPIAMRCTRVSSGCDHCWHLRMCDRIANNKTLPQYRREAAAGMIGPFLDPVELYTPLHVRKPSIIGVQFMGDMFHPSVNFFIIRNINKIMIRCQQHTFVILTKRPQWIRPWLSINYDPSAIHRMNEKHGNLILMTSVEDQKTADERIPHLLGIPNTMRIGISAEPLLGPITLPKEFLDRGDMAWVIAGFETGHHSRPGDLRNLFSISGQCRTSGVPFFDKGASPLSRSYPKGLSRVKPSGGAS